MSYLYQKTSFVCLSFAPANIWNCLADISLAADVIRSTLGHVFFIETSEIMNNYRFKSYINSG